MRAHIPKYGLLHGKYQTSSRIKNRRVLKMDKLCSFVTKPILIMTTWLIISLAGCGSYPDTSIQPVRSVPNATCDPNVNDIYEKDLRIVRDFARKMRPLRGS
jgi:hypothetical protein